MKKHDLKQRGLRVIHDRAAGIDVGSRFHVVAVPADLAKESIQTFQAFTADLERMANWLVSVGITTVAMESTGFYWIPVAVYEYWKRKVFRWCWPMLETPVQCQDAKPM